MEMPKVSNCEVSECAYNRKGLCHALAITVGDPAAPHCDTFCGMITKGGDPNSIAGVGACKMTTCKFNDLLECQAPSVSVGYLDDDIDCLTYTAK